MLRTMQRVQASLRTVMLQWKEFRRNNPPLFPSKGVTLDLNMKRIMVVALLFACSMPVAIAQPGASREGPLVSLYLPAGFPSEQVQVQYFMTGPFGGYSGFVRPEPDHQTIDFVAAVNGKPADGIKIIAYLPGCDLVVMDFPLAGTAMWRKLDCKPLSSVTLHGRISPTYANRRIEVAVFYQADWAFDFFGIRDGMVPSFSLSKTGPNGNGEFSVTIPDFNKQNLGLSSYVFSLRCRDCKDLAAPDDPNQTRHELPVAASYPTLIEFVAPPPS
jgi:hypothetical protein